MAAPDRRALVRGVHSFQDTGLPVPADVVLDTSFVVEALAKSTPFQAAAEAFMERLIRGGTVIYYNRLLGVEFVEVAFQVLGYRTGRSQRLACKAEQWSVRRRARDARLRVRSFPGDGVLTVRR